MQFFTHAFTAAAMLAATVSCAPTADAGTVVLTERQQTQGPVLTWWSETDFKPENAYYMQGEYDDRLGYGDCLNMGATSDIAMSAKAPEGYKCTLYSDKGCHGRRTKEFTSAGISNIGGKMAHNAGAWRCCIIGQTNGWGYCDGNVLNDGTD